MPYVFQTSDKSGKLHEKYRFQYTDWQGRRRTATGYKSKIKTEKLAIRIEAESEEIRKGYRPPPDSACRNRLRPFEEVFQEYLDWGLSQGGRAGRPWSPVHARKSRSLLEWWQKQLSIEVLADLETLLPNVERTLRKLQDKGKSGKTLQNQVAPIKSFCNWCSTQVIRL